jgi:2-polyprenyl-6-methoxyphenol hydroxylase-like FAD-dependent oxidoreductase
MRRHDVIIAGGGVGGLSAALGLARHGLEVLVLERRSGPGNVNRGDSLLPAVTTHLARWGALEYLHAAGARPVSRMQVFDRGRLLLDAPLDAHAPYLVLPHPEIERALAQAAVATGRVEVRYSTRSDGLLFTYGAVCGVRANGEELPARLVVGADGGSSSVRAALGVTLPTRPYRHAFFIVDVDRPDDYADAMRVELHPEGGVLMVPQAQGRVGLGVLVQPWQKPLFASARHEEKLAAVERRLGRTLRAHPGAHLYLLHRGHARQYVAPGAALLGDAVHVTNPTAGQGMTMAVEDAAALSRQVGPVLAAGGDLQRALLAYQAERRPRNAAQLRWSHWMSLAYAGGGPIADELRRQICRFGGSPLGRRIHEELWSQVAT